MNQEQFAAACADAIEPYHDAQLDGPLLVSTRTNAKYSTALPGWYNWPEYNAAIGHWPREDNGRDYGHYTNDPLEAIVEVTREAERLWTARQPECVCPSCMGDPVCHCGYSQADHERNPLAHEHSFVGYPCDKINASR